MKSGLLALLALAMQTVACAPSNGRQVDQSNNQAIADWMDWHDAKLKTDGAVIDAMNPPDGKANYPKAIAILESSGRPQSVIDLEVGNTILGAYRQANKAIMPKESAIQGIERLERAAAGEGEGAKLAPNTLVRWFTRGAGKAVLPESTIAACWQRVEAKTTLVADCISIRKKLLQ